MRLCRRPLPHLLVVVTGRYLYFGRFCLLFWKIILSEQRQHGGAGSVNIAHERMGVKACAS